AFTTTLDANGRAIAVEIRLFFPHEERGSRNHPGTDAGGRQLEADLRASLSNAHMVMFTGHSGPFYGFPMSDWKRTSEGDLSYAELAEVEMPTDRYQIVVADGCDTYQIDQTFRRNPHKPGARNLDVITTTSYGDTTLPYSIMNLILHLVASDPSGRHRPRTIQS